MFQGSLMGVSMKCQGCFMHVSWIESFKGVLRKFYESFKGEVMKGATILIVMVTDLMIPPNVNLFWRKCGVIHTMVMWGVLMWPVPSGLTLRGRNVMVMWGENARNMYVRIMWAEDIWLILG